MDAGGTGLGTRVTSLFNLRGLEFASEQPRDPIHERRGRMQRAQCRRLRALDEELRVDCAYSLIAFNCRVKPSRFTTSTLSQPPLGSWPETRQTFAVTTFGGRWNQSGLSPFVAVFMKFAQIGTASSPAYPLAMIVAG